MRENFNSGIPILKQNISGLAGAGCDQVEWGTLSGSGHEQMRLRSKPTDWLRHPGAGELSQLHEPGQTGTRGLGHEQMRPGRKPVDWLGQPGAGEHSQSDEPGHARTGGTASQHPQLTQSELDEELKRVLSH